MKVQLVRASGNPISEAHIKEYEMAFKARYDVILAEAGSDMQTVQQMVSSMEDELKAQYSIISTVELPKSQKGWNKLMELYKAPLMLALSADNTKQMIMVIMDQPFS